MANQTPRRLRRFDRQHQKEGLAGAPTDFSSEKTVSDESARPPGTRESELRYWDTRDSKLDELSQSLFEQLEKDASEEGTSVHAHAHSSHGTETQFPAATPPKTAENPPQKESFLEARRKRREQEPVSSPPVLPQNTPPSQGIPPMEPVSKNPKAKIEAPAQVTPPVSGMDVKDLFGNESTGPEKNAAVEDELKKLEKELGASESGSETPAGDLDLPDFSYLSLESDLEKAKKESKKKKLP